MSIAERTTATIQPSDVATPLVSVVIPCLNEEENIARCVTLAREVLARHGIPGEVVVADNASDDASAELADAAGARVVHEPRRGYGSAYLAGFSAARGRFIVMADADLTYDFNDIPRFVRALEDGADLVIGDRMDNIQPGAMPWLHRYVGNPVLSGVLNLFFRTGVRDAHCGMRGVRREVLPKLVRLVDRVGSSGVVIYSSLTADDADQAIQEQMAYFGALGQEFEWKAFSHDQPADLVQRLVAHGFAIDETEAVMVLDLQSTPHATAPPAVPVRRATRPDELDEVVSIKRRVYGEDRFRDLAKQLAFEMEQPSELVSVYVASLDGIAAACGWVRFPEKSVFAGLWGGSTVPELRNRGAYSALLAARLDEVRRRGRRYVTVDAGHMSRPILERHGFRILTHATACTWQA
jgi:GNAT superfamily N-acetyltransferase